MQVRAIFDGEIFHEVLFDDEDLDFFNNHSWYVSRQGYLITSIPKCVTIKRKGFKVRRYKRRTLMLFHRKVMGITDNTVSTDHIDHNKLNNQKSNLRVCSARTNAYNTRKCKAPRSSRFKGVSFCNTRKLFRANIKINNTIKHLGYFDDEVCAAKVYDKAAHTYFEGYAYLNFPNDVNDYD